MMRNLEKFPPFPQGETAERPKAPKVAGRGVIIVRGSFANSGWGSRFVPARIEREPAPRTASGKVEPWR